jgi:hypothetical protein
VSPTDFHVQRALAVTWFGLGRLDDVPLHFTDAVAVSDTRTMFLAVAERTTDAVTDGPVTGTVIGVIDDGLGTTTARWTRILDMDGGPVQCKFEGLVVDADRRAGWLLSDSDAPTQPANLCRVALAGFE